MVAALKNRSSWTPEQVAHFEELLRKKDDGTLTEEDLGGFLETFGISAIVGLGGGLGAAVGWLFGVGVAGALSSLFGENSWNFFRRSGELEAPASEKTQPEPAQNKGSGKKKATKTEEVVKEEEVVGDYVQ